MLYGCLTAYSQTDIKKLVAYSSVAHMGFVTAAFSTYLHKGSYAAASFVMWAHGLITGMLFFLVGMAYERYHSRSMDQVKHLASTYPQLGWSFVFAGMASLGLPGLAGFIGEFMTAYVVFEKFGYLSALVAIGVFLNATYLLKLIRNCVFTPAEGEKNAEEEKRLTIPELTVIYALSLITVVSGVFPSAIIKIIERVQ
jgi:NADH-quinone oxidoreductase subunit M